MARLRDATTPPGPVPRALRPFLRFARLPDRALAAVRRALEDDEFRAAVAQVAAAPAVATELDRPSAVYLARPDGWEDELAALAGEAAAAAAAEQDARDEQAAGRRAAHAEARARRAAEEAEAARRDLAALEGAVGEERRLRRAAEAASARASAAAEAAGERAEAMAAELAEARRRAAAEAARADELAARLAASDDAGPTFPDPAPAAGAVAAARTAAAALAAALDEAAAALAARPRDRAAGPGGEPAPPAGDGRRPAAARRALGLPPAVFDDSPEAAGHLVRAPGALLLVDGYNAAMAIWPGLGVTEVRLRLVDALAELAARTGVAVHAVFDGAEVPDARPPARPAGGVRVSFSPAGVEADDVILALVAALPASRPVLVASSDRRVREGARQLGANLLSARQLAAVLGR